MEKWLVHTWLSSYRTGFACNSSAGLLTALAKTCQRLKDFARGEGEENSPCSASVSNLKGNKKPLNYCIINLWNFTSVAISLVSFYSSPQDKLKAYYRWAILKYIFQCTWLFYLLQNNYSGQACRLPCITLQVQTSRLCTCEVQTELPGAVKCCDLRILACKVR